MLSKGALAYAVAFDGDDVVSVELRTEFELIVREQSGREKQRVRLGPADWDVNDLVVRKHVAYVASSDGTVRSFDVASGAEKARWHLGDAATAVAVSGAYVAMGTAQGVLCLRRLQDGALLQCMIAHQGRISGLGFDPAGGRLASAAQSGRAAVWSVPALASLAALDTGGSANAVAFAPDGARVAVATSARPPDPRRVRDERARVLVWRPVRGGPPPRVLAGHTGAVVAVVWDGQRVLSAACDRTVRLWDSGHTNEIARVSRFAHVLRDVAVSDDHRWAAAAAWAPRPGDPATTLLVLRHPP